MNQSNGPRYEPKQYVAKAHERVAGEQLGDIRLFVQMRLNHGLMMDGMNRCLAPYNLSNIGYMAMMLLYGIPEHMANPSDLCKLTGETRGNMTRICDDLVAKGWIKRVQSETDRRRVDLSLTEEGILLLQKVVPMLRDRARGVFSVFSEDEKAMLSNLLVRMHQSLECRFFAEQASQES